MTLKEIRKKLDELAEGIPRLRSTWAQDGEGRPEWVDRTVESLRCASKGLTEMAGLDACLADKEHDMKVDKIRKKLDGVISEVELLRSTWVKGNESRLGWVDRTVESLTTHREWFDQL